MERGGTEGVFMESPVTNLRGGRSWLRLPQPHDREGQGAPTADTVFMGDSPPSTYRIATTLAGRTDPESSGRCQALIDDEGSDRWRNSWTTMWSEPSARELSHGQRTATPRRTRRYCGPCSRLRCRVAISTSPSAGCTARARGTTPSAPPVTRATPLWPWPCGPATR